ncbi:XRE family transcriptional regulator [Nocardia fluminea]|uniref:XRE family transcriptional regulator n=1 Tax=Nocardia fluminea TaxID=134984 RepID=UPI0034462611
MSPNIQLQQRREGMPSRVVPNMTMSRAELADAINEHVWQTTGIRRDLDAHAIARYERGVVRWPNADYRRAMNDILGASDSELGFVRSRRRQPAEEQPDRALAVNLFSPFGPSNGPNSFLPGSDFTGPRSSRVGDTEIDAVRAATQTAASTENLHGGGSSAIVAANQALTRFAPMVHSSVSASLRRSLFEAIGNLSSVVGYTAFDAGEFLDADRYFQFALWCADSAGSWDLRASALADMARRSAFVGDPDSALSLIELAQVRSDRLAFTVRAMLSAMRAQYLAASGRTHEVIAEVARADELFEARAPDADPPWMCFYDTAEHLGSTGKALALAAEALNSIDVAAPRLRYAIDMQGPEYPRSRTFSQIRLAALTMKVGDPRDAAAIGREAVVHSRALKSARIATELRGLAAVASTHRRITEVGELRALIVTTTPREPAS